MKLHSPHMPSKGGLIRNRVLLSESILASDALVDMTLDPGFRLFEIDLIVVKPTDDDVELELTVSQDGGATFLGGSNYTSVRLVKITTGALAVNASGQTAIIDLCVNTSSEGIAQGSETNNGWCGRLWLLDPWHNGARSHGLFDGGYVDADLNSMRFVGNMQFRFAGPYDTVRIIGDAGELESGAIRLYGLEL